MSKESDELFAALRPAGLDELTAEAYGRRREGDLARALASPRGAAEGRRDPLPARPAWRLRLAVAGTAAAGLAAAAVVVPGAVGTGADPVPGGSGRAAATPAAPPRSVRLDARSVLLASATAAERASEETGAYWYRRERTFERIRFPGAGTGKPARRQELPYRAYAAHTQESWFARDGGARSRTVTGQDVKVTFASEADEAAWRKAGSPELWRAERSVNDYDMALKWLIGAHRMTMADLRALPRDEAGLEAELRRLHAAEKPADWDEVPDFPSYVWSTAQDLLAGPIRPATKAALYRVLARQDGIRAREHVRDPLGRTGVAVETTWDGEDGRRPARLIVDPGSGELLAFESRVSRTGEADLRVAYADSGWSDSLGEPPGD
ncbi:CU044_5270 family protein [Bailinhaonella thermotolerans]|uniref:CU044_5270 family protein n=1 Tax=Bailinhaonella thermotolerans TaxID=1070861 RepID=A0A3A4BUW5_9ACTN|nr:CU044_5270 family protein [Bailinhaonella thermotolerans]RJL35378.1 hypothetical protein D5H75_00715 [Bailinhaonella thermotolerans]